MQVRENPIGPELHETPREESSRLAARFSRWVAMGYQGSSKQKIEDIVGIGQLEALTHRKRVRWAASVYARNEPELGPRVERILREELGEDVTLTWMNGGRRRGETASAEIHEHAEEGEVVGYTDGSRMEGVAAGATAESGIFLGTFATVMDAEMIGIAGAWEEGYTTVASDSQAAIKRCVNITTGVQSEKSWIEERVVEAARRRGGGTLKMIWVKGHSGVVGNELADRRAKDEVMKGIWNSDRSLATPAGIRQAYPLYTRTPQMKWDREEVRGLTYLHTDRGPMAEWLFKIGRADSPRCKCGEIQNAQHLMASGCVAGLTRRWEDIWTDREFCTEVGKFLRNGGEPDPG